MAPSNTDPSHCSANGFLSFKSAIDDKSRLRPACFRKNASGSSPMISKLESEYLRLLEVFEAGDGAHSQLFALSGLFSELSIPDLYPWALSGKNFRFSSLKIGRNVSGENETPKISFTLKRISEL